MLGPVSACVIIFLVALLSGAHTLVVLIFMVCFRMLQDYIVSPHVMGKGVEMHPLLIFLSTLGGIILFGFSGFVIGPVVTSLLIALWEMYEEFYRKEKA